VLLDTMNVGEPLPDLYNITGPACDC